MVPTSERPRKKHIGGLHCNYGTWYLLERTNNDKRLSYSSFQTTSQPNFQVLSFLRNSNDLTADPRRTEKPIDLLSHIVKEISTRNGNEDIGGTTHTKSDIDAPVFYILREYTTTYNSFLKKLATMIMGDLTKEKYLAEWNNEEKFIRITGHELVSPVNLKLAEIFSPQDPLQKWREIAKQSAVEYCRQHRTTAIVLTPQTCNPQDSPAISDQQVCGKKRVTNNERDESTSKKSRVENETVPECGDIVSLSSNECHETSQVPPEEGHDLKAGHHHLGGTNTECAQHIPDRPRSCDIQATGLARSQSVKGQSLAEVSRNQVKRKHPTDGTTTTNKRHAACRSKQNHDKHGLSKDATTSTDLVTDDQKESQCVVQSCSGDGEMGNPQQRLTKAVLPTGADGKRGTDQSFSPSENSRAQLHTAGRGRGDDLQQQQVGARKFGEKKTVGGALDVTNNTPTGESAPQGFVQSRGAQVVITIYGICTKFAITFYGICTTFGSMIFSLFRRMVITNAQFWTEEIQLWMETIQGREVAEGTLPQSTGITQTTALTSPQLKGSNTNADADVGSKGLVGPSSHEGQENDHSAGTGGKPNLESAACTVPQTTVGNSLQVHGNQFHKNSESATSLEPTTSVDEIIDFSDSDFPAFGAEAVDDLPAETGETANFEAAAFTVPQTMVRNNCGSFGFPEMQNNTNNAGVSSHCVHLMASPNHQPCSPICGQPSVNHTSAGIGLNIGCPTIPRPPPYSPLSSHGGSIVGGDHDSGLPWTPQTRHSVFRHFPPEQGSFSRATLLYNQPEEIFPYTKPFCPVCNETMVEWEEHLAPFGGEASSNGKALRNELWHGQSHRELKRIAQKHTNLKHPQFKVWNIVGYLYGENLESAEQIFYASLRRCKRRVTPNSVLNIEAAKTIMDLRFNDAEEYIRQNINHSNWKKKLGKTGHTRKKIEMLVTDALQMMITYKNKWVGIFNKLCSTPNSGRWWERGPEFRLHVLEMAFLDTNYAEIIVRTGDVPTDGYWKPQANS
jgi:hypothetical protein